MGHPSFSSSRVGWGSLVVRQTTPLKLPLEWGTSHSLFLGWVGARWWYGKLPHSSCRLNGAPVILFFSGGLGLAGCTANSPTQAELEWGTSRTLPLGWVGVRWWYGKQT